MDDPKNNIDHDHTDDLVCPYCGHEHGDSWEFGNEDDAWQCSNCYKKFAYETEHTRTFTSRRVDCLNGALHDWVILSGVQDQYPGARRCRACRRREYKPGGCYDRS